MERISVWVIPKDYNDVIKYNWEVYDVLKKLGEKKEIKVDLVMEEVHFGPVLNVPVEVIVAGIGVLSAIVAALLSYLAKKKSGVIVLKGSSGRSIEIPKDTHRDDIDFYIKKAKELDISSIDIRELSD